MRGVQKYLIEYKTNIVLHFPGVRQVGSVNEEFYCSSSIGGGGKVMGGEGHFQEVQVNEKVYDRLIE